MIPFEEEASLTESEEYVESVLEKRWDHVVRATSGVLDDIGERYPIVSERVSESIREDIEERMSQVFRPGVPDFIAFDDSGDYLFVEVKSSDDGLRHTQLKWLRDFQGINCEIWFSEHEKDYEKMEASDFGSYSLRDKRGDIGHEVKEFDGNLMVELPEELASITGLESGEKVSWRLKSKDELVLDAQ
ncbi:MAG: VRR-NUC domain-containing protein [Candidatus Nanohaloarchaea archaeon]